MCLDHGHGLAPAAAAATGGQGDFGSLRAIHFIRPPLARMLD